MLNWTSLVISLLIEWTNVNKYFKEAFPLKWYDNYEKVIKTESGRKTQHRKASLLIFSNLFHYRQGLQGIWQGMIKLI